MARAIRSAVAAGSMTSTACEKAGRAGDPPGAALGDDIDLDRSLRLARAAWLVVRPRCLAFA
jgi:hypothetical protein